MTRYIALRQEEVTVVDAKAPAGATRRVLTVVGEYEAGSDEAACRAAARDLYRDDRDLTKATLVAVPARSFNPADYSIEPEPNVSKVATVSVAGLT